MWNDRHCREDEGSEARMFGHVMKESWSDILYYELERSENVGRWTLQRN